MMEIYADSLRVDSSRQTTRIYLADEGKQTPKAVVILPPAVAKQLAVILVSQIRQHEEASGVKVTLDAKFWEKIGVHPEDWW